MAIKDFLKKFFSSEAEEIKPEKVKLENIGKYLKSKKEELEIQENNVSESVKSRTSAFSSDLESQISVLKEITLNNKKAEEKIKLIVKENLLLYISYLEKMISSLKILDSKNLITGIDKIFLDFSKKSEIAYQKATFLIGKELGRTREIISEFIQNIKEIIQENHSLYETLSTLKASEIKLNEKSSAEKSESEIRQQQEQINLKLEDKKTAIDIINKEIERIKKSCEYLESEIKKQENEKFKEEIRKQAQHTRELVNFKKLSGIFHVSEKKMQILKEYNENFTASLERDNGNRLIELLIEANSGREVQEKLKELIQKIHETASFNESDETKSLESEIKKIELEIKLLNEERAKFKKAEEKLKEAKETAIIELKKQAEKINVSLE